MPDRRGFLARLAGVALAPLLVQRVQLPWVRTPERIVRGIDWGVGESITTRTLVFPRRYGKSWLYGQMIQNELQAGRRVTLAAANPDQMRRYVEDLNFIGPLEPDEE